MAKKKAEGYLSGRESRRISKANRKITNELEKKRSVLAKNLRKATNETEKSALLEKIRELDK